jgi:nucleoside-diphosphate-sugar epimerase
MTRTIAIAHARGLLGEMLCKLALEKGYRVFGIVFGETLSSRNLKDVTYLSIMRENELDLKASLMNDLSEIEVLIDAGGPYTLDISLIESDGHPESIFHNPKLIYKHPEFSTSLQSFYTLTTSQILGLALRLPHLKHFIGVGSLSLGHKLDPLESLLSSLHEETPVTLYEKALVNDTPMAFLNSNSRGKNNKTPPLSHPLGLSALRFERLVERSTGWQQPTVLRTIVRIGTLIGHSKTGFYPNLHGLYSLVPFGHQLARASLVLNKFPFLPLPFSERSRLSLIPVDVAAEAILGLSTSNYEDAQLQKRQPGQVAYRHITLPERDISVRRLFSATLRQLGLQTPPLALGDHPWITPVYSALGLETQLLELISLRVPANADQFLAEFPQFSMKPMIEYFPKMLEYAQKHLLHKQSIRGRSP